MKQDDRQAHPEQTEEQLRAARRRFLASCGRFAVVTPPAVALLLSASRQNYAGAASGRINDDPPSCCALPE